MPGQEGSGVRFKKGSDNQHVVEGACGKAWGWGGARATGDGDDGGGVNVFALAATRADVALNCGKGRGIAGATTAMTTTMTHKQALAATTAAIVRCPSPKRRRIVGPTTSCAVRV